MRKPGVTRHEEVGRQKPRGQTGGRTFCQEAFVENSGKGQKPLSSTQTTLPQQTQVLCRKRTLDGSLAGVEGFCDDAASQSMGI